MNNLSWLIYFAEVSGSLGLVSVLLAILFIFLGFLLPPNDVAAFSSYHTPFSGFKNISVVFGLSFFLILAVFLPSQKTIYMIAASEIGEQVIKTPEAKEVFDSLKARIMDELKVEAKP